MDLIYSVGGVPIRMTEERWQHLSQGHPEMGTLRNEVLETVARPDFVQEGDTGELLAIRYVEKTPLTSKYLVAAYKETNADDGFLVTSYLTREPSSRWRVIWTP